MFWNIFGRRRDENMASSSNIVGGLFCFVDKLFRTWTNDLHLQRKSICGIDYGRYKQRIVGAVEDDGLLDSSRLQSLVSIIIWYQDFNSGRKDVMRHLNNNNVPDCCIGIPVYFTHQQRRERLEVLTCAGWKPCRLLHQTTAAALMYRFSSTDLLEYGKMSTIAFIDMGYEAMQVSIVELGKDQLKVLSHAYDGYLGGRAFDSVLAMHYRLVRKDDFSYKDLKERWSTEIEVEYEGLVLKRVEFEVLSFKLLKRVKVVLDKALNESGIAVKDVHSVEVVGYGSKIPAVMEVFRDFFNKEPRETVLEGKPVATGCFIQCAMLCGAYKIPTFQIIDIIPYSIELADEMKKRQVVFLKGSPLPTMKISKSVIFVRQSTFFLDLHYRGLSDMISYMIGPFESSKEMEVNVDIQLDLHGISCIESATIGVIAIPVVEYSIGRNEKRDEKQKQLLDSSKHLKKFVYTQDERVMTEMDKIIADERIEKQKLQEFKAALELQLCESNACLETTTKQHKELRDKVQKAEKKLDDVAAKLEMTENSLNAETNMRLEAEKNLEGARNEHQKLNGRILSANEHIAAVECQLPEFKTLLQTSRKQQEELQTTLRTDVQKVQKELADVFDQLNGSLEVETKKRTGVEKTLKEEKKKMQELGTERKKILKERDDALKEVAKLRQMIVNFSFFSLSELKQATNNFHISCRIGEGGFGTVYKCLLRHVTVAIKKLNEGSSQGDAEFNQEVEILYKARHPNLVALIGVCLEGRALVYEFMPNGSLDAFLTGGKNSQLSWQDRIRIASEICSALIFLHSLPPHGIAHGDLKPENILLASNFTSKLSDFGISRKLQLTKYTQTPNHFTKMPRFTGAYVDPEYISSNQLTPKSDTYSFGIIMLQLVTGRKPQGIMGLVDEAVENDKLDTILDSLAGDWPIKEAEKLAKLGLRCSAQVRWKRPDLAKVVLPLIKSMKHVAESTLKEALISGKSAS